MGKQVPNRSNIFYPRFEIFAPKKVSLKPLRALPDSMGQRWFSIFGLKQFQIVVARHSLGYDMWSNWAN